MGLQRKGSAELKPGISDAGRCRTQISEQRYQPTVVRLGSGEGELVL